MDASYLIDLDASSAFFSNPPSPLLLSPSRSLPHPTLSHPSPTPPQGIFINKLIEFPGHTDSEKEDDNLQNDKIRSSPMPSIKEVSDFSYMMKERMMQALRYFKEWTNHHVLVQFWVPVRNEDRYVLTTSEQPFVLDPDANGLLQYRTVSLMYLFSFDEDNDGALGLPGRVFKLKLPEWTPNVQYYSSKEYPRLSHALLYNVRGSLGLPVFEPSSQSCVGVVELITTSEMVNYAPEVDKVCKALEAVNLRSSKILEDQSIQSCNEGRHAALVEILEILTVVCEAQKLPLAQTWVPCQHDNILAHRDSPTCDGSCMGHVCMSTSGAAFHVVDAHMWGFRDACSEHHLQKGQGVVGRAFAAKHSCFCSDITKFSKTEYPLVHYAQMFGLGSCLALFLRSSHSEDDVYIAEFFLPSDCKDLIRQRALLESISTLLKQSFQSLKVIIGAEVEGQPFEFIDIISYANHEMQHVQDALPTINTLEGLHEKECKCNTDHSTPEQHLVSCINSDKSTTLHENGCIPASTIITNEVAGRKRGKAEKIISLEVLQQYFKGCLKDAAKSLGVCPTTLKRICRQHGISRWPSRKINKVNRSISELKHVIESVQNVDVALNVNPLIRPLLLTPGTMSLPVQLDRDSVSRAENTSHFKTLEVNDSHDKVTSKEQPFSTNSNQYASVINFLEDQNMVPLSSRTDVVLEPELAESDILIEDSTSSKSARNPPSTFIQDRKTVVVKAHYKEDIIRFRMVNDAGIMALAEEIGKRLMLEVGSFEIKYLDDDHDWVRLHCDEDLEECLEISSMSDSSVIRLSVQDICLKAPKNVRPEMCIP
ncbi:protein NLP3 [Phalaenopsis equestris]|uniref:protein NLP3 n=1 Tax=Phalaenopsis equestris TaxID=78828 RepID=UPI0009E3FC95|nr:protein NLP3 [Phalaenopsis equestris]